MPPILKPIEKFFTNGFREPAPTSALTSRKKPVCSQLSNWLQYLRSNYVTHSSFIKEYDTTLFILLKSILIRFWWSLVRYKLDFHEINIVEKNYGIIGLEPVLNRFRTGFVENLQGW